MLLVLEIIVGVYILWLEIVIFNDLLWRISIDPRVWQNMLYCTNGHIWCRCVPFVWLHNCFYNMFDAEVQLDLLNVYTEPTDVCTPQLDLWQFDCLDFVMNQLYTWTHF